MKQSRMKKTSISAFLSLSLPLLYLSLLNTSPSNLIKDTTFWFLLSNSIILFIAADSGFFSAPNDTNIHINNNHFVSHNTSYNIPPCLVEEQSNNNTENHANVKEKHLNCSEIDRESVKNASYPPAEKPKTPPAEKPKTPPAEKPKTQPKSPDNEEESEYWKMSDEELNKRVEEFIRRFNRELSSNSNR